MSNTNTSGIAKLLSTLPDRLPPEVTVGDILNAMGGQGVAIVLSMFAVAAMIPTPGIPAGTVFGAVLALLSVQVIFGAKRLWLPRQLSALDVPRSVVEWISTRGSKILARLERHIKPRGKMLSKAVTQPALGLIILAMAILIVLPIPFGNALPGLAVLIMALGMAQRDSLTIGAGLLIAIIAASICAGILAASWRLVAA